MPSGTSQAAALAFGQAYLTSVGVTDSRVTADRCRFCHVEKAIPEMEEAIAAHGYFILPMEGCPPANTHHKLEVPCHSNRHLIQIKDGRFSFS